jgi:hypothetical protein
MALQLLIFIIVAVGIVTFLVGNGREPDPFS